MIQGSPARRNCSTRQRHTSAPPVPAFPFTLTAGFTGFSTPATFIRFNRAIKARLEAYRSRWPDVLAALNESFITSPSSGGAAALATGVFNSYPSGEATNNLFQATPTTLLGVPSFLDDAQRRADGTPDLRASSKAQVTSTTVSVQGVSSNVKITAYASNNANVPIIRNEELVLLRAEANIALGDRAAAITDLNYVRVNAGGLAPLPPTYSGDLVDETALQPALLAVLRIRAPVGGPPPVRPAQPAREDASDPPDLSARSASPAGMSLARECA